MAMKPICERVHKIVSRRRKNEVEPTDESEIVIALRFLHKFVDRKDVYRRWIKCTKNEGTCLCQRESGFEIILLIFKRKKNVRIIKKESASTLRLTLFYIVISLKLSL